MKYSEKKVASTFHLPAALMVLAIFFGSMPALAGGNIHIALTDDGVQMDELAIGRHLDVGLLGGVKGVKYTVRLVDENNQVVASTRIRVQQANHWTALKRLWNSTGIVGCDPGANPNTYSYRFLNHGIAEAVLNGRTFKVLVYKGFAGVNSVPVAETDLSFKLDTSPIRAFGSDGSGCLRSWLEEGENLHLSIQHTKPTLQIYTVSVVKAQNYWEAGDPVNDLRPSGSQMITVPSGQNPTVVLLWSEVWVGEPPSDDIQIIVQPGASGGTPFDPIGDFKAQTINWHAPPRGGTADECRDDCIPSEPGG